MIFLKDLLISILFMNGGALNQFMCTMYIQELVKARRGPQIRRPELDLQGTVTLCEALMWLPGNEFMSSAMRAPLC